MFLKAVVVFFCVFGFVRSYEAKTALIVVDVQNCFLYGGTLAVGHGNEVIAVINNIRSHYDKLIALTVFTQDWHCWNHVSFASQHSGKKDYDVINLTYNDKGELCTSNDPRCVVKYNISQTLWPDHCVINTTDAKISANMSIQQGDVIVQKGYHCQVDSYSGFYDNGGFSHTEMNDVLKKNGITQVLVTGLALDFCVYYTSKDAKKLGYDTFFILDATRPVFESNVKNVTADLLSKGVHVINSTDIGDYIRASATRDIGDYIRASATRASSFTALVTVFVYFCI
ncbi:nicotinamidase-like [Dreissena polymorpha]|uniref:nicotinamidase n=1 Tax=Dreissena polymorpha TaxID=45954 RepID=A0A9D4MKP2_DREPO|nr:nicotinamidase-like [Dreissena polymorpha]KAH3877166.1 hypothetical protein DPMN_001023 [Dreissena polymorpha]